MGNMHVGRGLHVAPKVDGEEQLQRLEKQRDASGLFPGVQPQRQLAQAIAPTAGPMVERHRGGGGRGGGGGMGMGIGVGGGGGGGAGSVGVRAVPAQAPKLLLPGNSPVTRSGTGVPNWKAVPPMSTPTRQRLPQPVEAQRPVQTRPKATGRPEWQPPYEHRRLGKSQALWTDGRLRKADGETAAPTKKGEDSSGCFISIGLKTGKQPSGADKPVIVAIGRTVAGNLVKVSVEQHPDGDVQGRRGTSTVIVEMDVDPAATHATATATCGTKPNTVTKHSPTLPLNPKP